MPEERHGLSTTGVQQRQKEIPGLIVVLGDH